MARYYGEISKEDFLKKVKELMDIDEYPYEMPNKISEDLKKVNFDFENYTWFNTTSGFSKYPVGYHELAEGFHVFFVNAGGDWEFPICFIFYWSSKNKIRAYIPKDGNAWNKKFKCAYGSESNKKCCLSVEELETYEKKSEDASDEIDEEKIIDDILKRIVKKI